MRYHIVDSNETFNNPEDAVDYCIEQDFHDEDDDYFEEYINELYGLVNIGGIEYRAYDVLDKMGDLCEFVCDYQESENERDRDSALYNLKHADVGDIIDCQNYEIQVIEDDDGHPEDDILPFLNDDEVYATGDDDGDTTETAIDRVRRFYDEQAIFAKEKAEEERKNEDDMMKLFQVIK